MDIIGPPDVQDADTGSETNCRTYLEELIKKELQKDEPDVAKISIALGVVEEALSHKVPQERRWPSQLHSTVEDASLAFQAFVSDQNNILQALTTPRDKVKALADAVWSYLTGSFSKDVLHVQHVSQFTKYLGSGKQKISKRQLDCAGVTTTVYAACHALAARHGHEDLGSVRMQISEDHCFLQLDSAGSREGSVEVTADTSAKRGLPAQEDLWHGWLYCGGRAVQCSRHGAIAAAVVSVNPLLGSGKKAENSEALMSLQRDLLEIIYREVPNAMYPAAIAALADLKDAAEESEVETALGIGDVLLVEKALQRRDNGAHTLFEKAIEASRRFHGDLQWYPYSYYCGHLCRRADLLEKAAQQAALSSNANTFRAQALEAFKEGMKWIAAGSSVLTLFIFQSEDEELYKDIGEMLEYCVDGLTILHKEYRDGHPLNDPSLLEPLLVLWDGVCVLFAQRSKPAAWIRLVLKGAKLFTPDARDAAAGVVPSRSLPMQKARSLWRDLKAVNLTPLFEAADVGEGQQRNSKRSRMI